jgi:hypothetical protein
VFDENGDPLKNGRWDVRPRKPETSSRLSFNKTPDPNAMYNTVRGVIGNWWKDSADDEVLKSKPDGWTENSQAPPGANNTPLSVTVKRRVKWNRYSCLLWYYVVRKRLKGYAVESHHFLSISPLY